MPTPQEDAGYGTRSDFCAQEELRVLIPVACLAILGPESLGSIGSVVGPVA